jgi:hypothetical protein
VPFPKSFCHHFVCLWYGNLCGLQGSNDTNDMPMVVVPLSLSAIEIAFGMLFLAGFFIMKLGIYRNYPWLYAKLLNISTLTKKLF